jgi:subtilisin family serine protease
MKFAIALLCAMALCHVQAAPAQSIVCPSLHKAASEGPVDIMVILKDPVAPLIKKINTLRFANSAAKTSALVSQLREFTQTSQNRILAFLREQRTDVQVKAFWITNKISVKAANLAVIEDLANNFSEQIAEIREAKVIHLEDDEPVVAPAPQALEWGVQTIQADQAWAQDITGRGVVVSSIDTGVRSTHVVLADGMRQSYNWFDGTSLAAQEPADSNGHGTHTMGTIAGITGTGVAPGSKWVHCRAFEGGSATEEALLVCGQWITCPTLPDGRDEDCGQKPQVCSNSWGGGNEDPFYNDVIDTWQASSIVPVFAIGNSGPLCRTAGSPGDQPNVISVGATNAQNLITQFSSHGPSRTALRIKPEVSAPGNNIRSASNLGDRLYSYLSGTSMACPHVAGAVALLLEKNGNATFQEISEALFKTTLRPEMPDILCPGGGVNTTYPWPNNSHGWGNIRVNDALGQL